MSENRNWMYQRLIDAFLNPEFVFGVDKFLEFSSAHSEWMEGEKNKVSMSEIQVSESPVS